MTFTKKDNPPSVMMVITSFNPLPMGGSERQAFRLARELKQRGLNAYVVALGRKESPGMEQVDGVTVYRFYSMFTTPLTRQPKKSSATTSTQIEYMANNPANFVVAAKKSLFSFIPYAVFFLQLTWFVRRRKQPLDIIYVPMMEWTALLGAWLGRIFNKKVFIKDSTVNGITNILRYPFGRLMQSVIIKKCYFVAMTGAIEENYKIAGIPGSRIFRISNGVSLPEERDASCMKPEKFVFVGNLYQQPAKGVDVLLKAWRLVVNQRADLHLFLIGDGDTAAYMEYAQSLGVGAHVHFLGKMKNFDAHLAEAIAFILPSRREGMSNALLEAMAFGLPVIATDISGNQDLVTHGVNGLLVPVEDETALAAAIIDLREDTRRAIDMGRKARQTIRDEFTFEHVAEKYCELFLSSNTDRE